MQSRRLHFILYKLYFIPFCLTVQYEIVILSIDNLSKLFLTMEGKKCLIL